MKKLVFAILTYGIAYFIPTEDEWYKAAYYTGSGYSTYAYGTDTAPVAGVDTNFNNAIGQPWNVGTGTIEQNGTFDMMGNVHEWNEEFLVSGRIRGGSYESDGIRMSESYRQNYAGGEDDNSIGFRVTSVPEPLTISILAFGAILCRRKR
jgi:formylglycine-generating enzyme required for sulfatase activity